MYGGFQSLNMTALYVLGTNFKSNTACFLFATGMYSYINFPQYISYNVTNYIAGNLWIILVKYVSDGDRRSRYLLEIKDKYWTLIMKG